MKSYDLVIQLGSQVNYVDGQYQLAPHTRMRTEASAIVLRMAIAPRLVICGGSNFGVRYGNTELLQPPNFSFGAFAEADFRRNSEAAVIKDVLVEEFQVRPAYIFAESLSSTTEENAEFVRIILRRRPMFTGHEKIAILTQLYHMEKALPVFKKVGLDVDPLFAENVLAMYDTATIGGICEYYRAPRGGKQYSPDAIRNLLTEGKSLAELMD